MARVELRGTSLVIVFNDGTSRSSGVNVTAAMNEAQIGEAITRARNNVAAEYYGSGDDAHASEARNASGSASAIYRQLHPETRTDPAQPAAPATPAQPAQPAATGGEGRGRRRRAETPAAPPTPQPAAPAQAEAPAGEGRRRARTAETTPRPAISVDWIGQQLRDARGSDRTAQGAATALHANSTFVEQFLSPDLQRGVMRTDSQRDVTIALFNALYQIPSFRLYLSSLAAQQQSLPQRERIFQELVTLQTFLTEPGRNEQLSTQAQADIISAADMYIRYYLLNFVAANSDYSRYRGEIEQLPTTRWRLQNVEGARTFQPTSGRAPSDADRAALMRLYLGGPIDSDTLTATALWLRRWSLENPERGRGRSQSQISAWRAPDILVPAEVVSEAGAAQPAAAAVTGQRIVIIGDSLVEGGRIGTTLQTTLGGDNTAASRGVAGESIAAIRSRFQRDVLDAQPPYTTVVIEGGINGITGTSVANIESNFTAMISAARAKGMRVVLVGLIPWAGYSGSTDAAQQSTATLNQWLRSQATADGNVVFVDTSALGEGNPPRLRAAYERDTRPDHLHPNSAGLDLIARQIAQAAFGRAPAAAETRTALQDFADRNWRSLAAEFYQAAQQGRPQAAVTLMRNLPAGETSIESSLRTLNRDDIPRAIDRIFNDYLHRDSDFLTFCRSQRDYQGVALESVTLSATSTPSDRRLVMRSIQAYLNYVAGRSGEDWYARWRDELRFVSRDVLRLGRDDMSVDGLDNLRMIVAVAAFSWRKANRTAAVGEWASSLGIRPSTTTTAPPQVQPQPAQPAEPQRRRVIQPGAP